MRPEIEKRVLLSNLELRANGNKKTLVGYAALYDSPSSDLGGFIEVIRPGAFDRAIAENQDVMARYEHETNKLLGKSSSGTLRVWSDAKGLKYEVDLPDTQAGRDVLVLAERGDVSGSSFAFRIPDPKADQRWTETSEGYPLRELLNLDLVDVAPTANPAYPETTVSARALETAKEMMMLKSKNPQAETDASLRSMALARVLSRRSSEQREQSYEDRMTAIYAALYALLGSPWMTDDNWWCVEATYDDSVVVETFRGAVRYFQYPLSFGVDGVPRLGEPSEVVLTFAPTTPEVADAGADARPELGEAREITLEEQQELDRLAVELA